ncbi:hypothetical protein [Anditalea andensis]|uniref:Outer membrane protein beta-barrel domain-containing protein n=1 Tax=Anditalea andensis TaxID=1048983 RepID=A0A074KUQ9_9BACT|nr:hypothetical protein [Anditalea andensis]KEO72604.1 hypothetical protein EL17_17860 [Anditalea andensis]
MKSTHIRIISIFVVFFIYSSISAPLYGQNFYKDLTPRDRQVIFGLGPSVAITDFSYHDASLPSVLLPSGFIAFSQQLRPHFSLVTTGGFQSSESNHRFTSVASLNPFVDVDQAISYKNFSGFLDIMPQFNIWKSDSHIWRPSLQIYGGVGLGIIATTGVNQYITLRVPDSEFVNDGDINRTYVRENRVTGYVPIRIGVNKKIHPNWDIGLQATYMYLFTDRFDGNNIINNANDRLFQLHFTIKRYLSPSFAPIICY